ncbi:ribonuclease YeeF family protein [Listeria welshimeri]|uniref:TNT domain-containing protein n=1 Tax=Listeria welshimeri TaxID=1643 RepID=UPI001888BC26|nr:glycohydrolase toxin TNT-related protein [Listeria welshimeri]MBF2465406.1 ribonuclease YeeF family protein [Listeria welshimeri]
MKDINYQEDDWREAKSALAPFAAANWMGGLFNNLVKVAENMEEAEADIQELDSDGAISFQHTNHTGKYSTIEEDLLVLYKFCCHAGERMENLVNLPFYEKLDAFVGGMQELSISTYATTNRMEVKEQRTVTTGEYAQSFETIKAEVTMEDLLNGDNFYANQMQLQYRDWKRANPDQDVSEADFKMSMIHTRAFEYKSIKNEQEEKEFWVSIVATVGIIAVSVLCPPAGLALSVAYGGLEISSAVSGKDWFSGRELSTGERYTRAGFGVLDIIPGVKAFTTGAKAVGTGSKLLRLGDNVLADSKNIGRLAKGTMGEGLQAGKQAMHLRLSNAQKIAQQAGANVQRKLAKDWNDLGAAAKAIQGKAKQAIPLAPRERLALAGAGGSIPEQSVAGASAAATKKKLQEMMRKMDNLNVKGSGESGIIKGISGADKYLDDVEIPENMRKWRYTPNKELYSKYEKVYKNPKYYDQLTGDIKWPVDDGFSKGSKVEKEIAQDTIFKRYGGNSGEYLGNATDSFESRALAPHSEGIEVHYYQLTEDFRMTTGKAAPWFGSEGGGEQFVKYKPDGSKYTIKELEDAGMLEDITDLVKRGEVRFD